MSCKIDNWKATATGSGGDRLITVSGEGECTQRGYRLRLEATNEGVIDNPDEAALRLVVEAPEYGSDVMTPAHVETEIHGDPASKIRIDTPEGSIQVEVGEG
jgi:hypothetical protein